MKFFKQTAFAVVAVIGLAACGGSTAATIGPAPTSTSGGAATPAPAHSDAPAAATATAAPAAATPVPPPPAGGATLSPADAATKLCGLLTPADLKTATGLDFGAGVADVYGLCTFEVGGGSANTGAGQVTLALLYNDFGLVKSSFAGGTDLNVGSHPAYWDPDKGLQSLWVDLGNGSLLVVSIDPVDNNSQAAAQALATVIVDKM